MLTWEEDNVLIIRASDAAITGPWYSTGKREDPSCSPNR
jgi:hypothetical protein